MCGCKLISDRSTSLIESWECFIMRLPCKSDTIGPCFTKRYRVLQDRWHSGRLPAQAWFSRGTLHFWHCPEHQRCQLCVFPRTRRARSFGQPFGSVPHLQWRDAEFAPWARHWAVLAWYYDRTDRGWVPAHGFQQDRGSVSAGGQIDAEC